MQDDYICIADVWTLHTARAFTVSQIACFDRLEYFPPDSRRDLCRQSVNRKKLISPSHLLFNSFDMQKMKRERERERENKILKSLSFD